ncbi:MAG: response regulator, partial [Candidatus Latescibacteria bacterium]|nr:response regulator [Candidatus Latescibacterota bacterium]
MERTSMAAPEKSGKSVLIVDGNRLDGQLAGVILERFGSGYKCEIAITRRQAADALAKRAYDLVLLDTDIQERLDGLKLVQLILMRERSRSKDSAPLTILFSSKPDRETVQQGVSLGVTDFIAKPYPPQSLLQRIEKAMQARGEMTEKNFAESLTQALKQISHIPTLSAVFAKVQALLTAPEPSV